jgi:ribonuclease P protein component
VKKNGLSAREKIRRRKDLTEVYQSGKSILSSDKNVKVYYLVENVEQPGVKFAVTVSKKLGGAVWRNRIKRILREAYRLSKHKLIEMCEVKKREIKLVLSPYKLNQREHKDLKLKDVEHCVIEIIDKITQRM